MKKNSNILWAVGISAIILVGFIWLSSAGKSNSQNTPGTSSSFLSADETSFDFGNTSMAKGKVSHIFKIKNAGSEPLTINKIYTSCMCTEANFLKGAVHEGPFGMPGMSYIPSISETLATNEEAQIEVIFDPAAHGPAGLGNIQRTISLENNSKSRLDLSISAEVMP